MSTEPSERTAATHSHTLDRGLRALEALAGQPEGLSVAELAILLDTHRAAVYRLLGPLSDHRLVRREQDGRFTLGVGLVELAAAVRPRLQEVAQPVLQALADELRATTALTIRDGDDAVVAQVVAPREPQLHLIYPAGMRHSLNDGAPGHVLLAALPAQPTEPANVSRARSQGYAISHGELLPGATGVAAVIPAAGHEPEAALSAVWIEGIDPHRAADAVRAAAARIGEQLGG